MMVESVGVRINKPKSASSHIHIHSLYNATLRRTGPLNDILLALTLHLAFFTATLQRPSHLAQFYIPTITHKRAVGIVRCPCPRSTTVSDPALYFRAETDRGTVLLMVSTADFRFRLAVIIAVVDGGAGSRTVTLCLRTEEEGEVAADEGAENHDAAADDGEICLHNNKGGGGWELPGSIGCAEQEGHVVCADYRNDAGQGPYTK